MEFTELADYAISPGMLTEWLPEATGTWAQDERPASYIHEAHLRPTADGTHDDGRESWLGAAFRIAGPLDHDAFRRAARTWIDRHEPLRSHAELGADGRISRHTLGPGGVDFDEVRHEYEFDTATVLERVHHLFDELTSPHRWPAYLFVTLEHSDPEAGCTVFFAADHSLIDGLSVVLVAHELTSLYTEAMAGPPALLVPAGSYIDFGADERAAAATVDRRHPAVEVWRQAFLRSKGRLSEFPLDLGPRTVERVPQRAVSEWVLDAAQAVRFNTVCHRAGQNFLAGVLACLAEANTELTGNTVFRTVTPVHTRNDPHWATSLGWFVGLAPIEFDIAGAVDFADVATRAAEAVAATKSAAKVPFARVEEILGTPIRPRFVVSFMDVRFVPMAQQWPEIEARALRSRHYTHDVYIWVNRTPHGVNISARFPETPLATENVLRFLARTRRALADVVPSTPDEDPQASAVGADAYATTGQ
ncbi:condensation domain-containing protein [Rhodococcus sp. SGAir0479]|uniref:condensation domain-containing protein n=1 Tax=Rhodococcus sp. SGAir0479 TaxID=2567884 RepID=UPI0010CD5866|nr:condensation domain-containing protein [Rhodococcus sp. SGAir0479]QCQ92041.1 condensation protein [Rhodococcus sp. SGAir0479]